MKLEVLAHLTTLYSGKDRHYHDINHIQRMIADWYRYRNDMVAECEPVMGYGDALYPEHSLDEAMLHAIWFHDSVYMPGAPAGLSEFKSANMFSKSVSDSYCVYTRQDVREAILSTADHAEDVAAGMAAMYAGGIPFVTKALLDIDLLGLADPYYKFQESTRRIWKEYATIISRSEFIRGRVAFFNKLLTRPNLYYFKFLNDKFDAVARQNIQLEMGQLHRVNYF